MIIEAIKSGKADWVELLGHVQVIEGDVAVCVLPEKVARAAAGGDATALRFMARSVARQSIDADDAVVLVEAVAELRRAFPRIVKAGNRLGRVRQCRVRGAERAAVV